LTIGEGVKSLQDIEQLLKVGTDKVCINSTAVNDLDFVKKAVDKYGSQCIVISIDYKINKDKMTEVFTSSGNKATNLSLEEHIKNLDEVSPGEIILTSIDHDGMMNGYDIEKIKKISNSSSIPVIASGGAGCVNDFYQVIKDADIKALSAASIFHFTEITPLDVKKKLKTKNINVRL